MSNPTDAKAKEVEGKLESAAGELTGDVGHQIKGKAKQVQASAMNAVDNLKEGTKSVAHAISNAADNVVDSIADKTADKTANNVAKDHS
ncbi:MAG: CsbD family protein [Cyanobium sp. ELA712]